MQSITCVTFHGIHVTVKPHYLKVLRNEKSSCKLCSF